MNRNLVMIVGKSASGKSASLMNLKDPKGVAYMNCESGKELPFKSSFRELVVTNPYQVYAGFDELNNKETMHTAVIDTVSFLMDMFESTVVLTSTDGRKAWGDYAQFFKKLMQEYVAKSSKNVIMLAHTMDQLNEKDGVVETLVKVKGSLMNQGIESYFCNVVAAKKMSLSKLDKFHNPMLVITPEEEALGFKYVFQTRLTKETVHERIRGPLGLWSPQETFIDNDAQKLLEKLQAYYN
jgi:hypothetical protein